MQPKPSERRHSKEEEDNRNAYERDRDRVIYSGYYRRLGGVTQVVSALEGHVFHNRLTHTFKVAQVGRRISERLLKDYEIDTSDHPSLTVDVLNPDVVEAAGHAHDIGHPPFGHIAEQKLQQLMEEACEPDTFEGNAQSFRVVTRLARRDRTHPGLDLTRRTLDAILKYPWQAKHDKAKKKKKWGAYSEETEDFDFARAGKNKSVEQSLEASVMDWADDITYAVHDVEDLLRARIIAPDRLRHDDKYKQDFAEWVEEKWRLEAKFIDGQPIRLTAISRALEEVTSLLAFDREYQGSYDDTARLRMHSSYLINKYIRLHTELRFRKEGWFLHIPQHIRLEVDVLKELTWRYMIDGPSLAAQQYGQKVAIANVYGALMNAADSNSDVDKSILPARARDMLNGKDSTSPAYRARVVADTICSMTEEELIRFNARLTGVTLGSVRDSIV